MVNNYVPIKEVVKSANTGLDAIKRAPIVEKDTGIKCLRIQDVSQRKKYDDWGNTEVEARNFEKFQLKKNDIIVARTGASIGVNLIIKENLNSVLNNGLIRIRVDNEKCDPDYLYYNFRSSAYEGFIESISGGTSTQPNMQINALLSYKINLPPLPEQKAIASVLSSLDDKIDLLHRQNKTLEVMAETLFRQWFVEEAREDSKSGTIADLIDFNPPRKLAKGTMAPYLEMAALSNSTFSPDDWYDREFSSGTKFINGDTLLARITPCLENGKTAYVTFLKGNQVAWGSTEYIVMRPKGNLHPFFAYALARNSDFRDYAEGCMEGSSGRQRVNVDHLKDYEIKLPSELIVIDFNKIADSIVPKLHSNLLHLRTLEELRDTLLPKLMSGEVRVQYGADQSNVISIMDQLRQRAYKSCENKGYVDISKIANEMGIAVVKDLSVNKAQIKREGDVYTIHVKEPEDNFSIAHEMVHYAEDQEHIKKYAVGRKDEYSLNKAHEKKTDALAAEIIMPEEYVRGYIASNGDQNQGRLDKKLIQKCAKQFRVSEIAMRYRLENLGYRLRQR